jgi:hypothetical protein
METEPVAAWSEDWEDSWWQISKGENRLERFHRVVHVSPGRYHVVLSANEATWILGPLGPELIESMPYGMSRVAASYFATVN